MLDLARIRFNEVVWHDQPYTHPQTGQIVGRDFFNRSQVIQQAEACLQAGSRTPVILIGERRSGKTSLLRLLANRLQRHPDPRFLPLLIPWRDVERLDTLVQSVVDGLWFELDQNIPMPPADAGRLDRVQFIEELRRLLAAAPGKTLVLCIDEFDAILHQASIHEGEAGRILRLVEHLTGDEHNLPIRVLLTAARQPADISGLDAAPFFNSALQLPLAPFDEPAFERMLVEIAGREGLSPQERAQIFDLSGAWPYFTKLLLVHLSPLPHDPKRLQQALSQAVKDPGVAFTLENIFKLHFSSSEQALALLLAGSGGQLPSEALARCGPEIRTAAARLEARFYLQTRGPLVGFRIGFLAHWLPAWAEFEQQRARLTHNLEKCLQGGGETASHWQRPAE